MIGIVCAFFHTDGKGDLPEPLTSAIVHEGQLTLAKAYVSVGSQSFP